MMDWWSGDGIGLCAAPRASTMARMNEAWILERLGTTRPGWMKHACLKDLSYEDHRLRWQRHYTRILRTTTTTATTTTRVLFNKLGDGNCHDDDFDDNERACLKDLSYEDHRLRELLSYDFAFCRATTTTKTTILLVLASLPSQPSTRYSRSLYVLHPNIWFSIFPRCL